MQYWLHAARGQHHWKFWSNAALFGRNHRTVAGADVDLRSLEQTALGTDPDTSFINSANVILPASTLSGSAQTVVVTRVDTGKIKLQTNNINTNDTLSIKDHIRITNNVISLGKYLETSTTKNKIWFGNYSNLLDYDQDEANINYTLDDAVIYAIAVPGSVNFDIYKIYDYYFTTFLFLMYSKEIHSFHTLPNEENRRAAVE